ncbi:MAG: hypothetical protein JRM77_09530 [Nitrososphaerota archaeon]|nr:hypothetical protein [Nitrososphaerota archaeon]
MAVLLVPVPEGTTIDGEVGVSQVQDLESVIDYLQVSQPVPASQEATREQGVLPGSPREIPEGMADLRPLKKHVARLPSNHPLRFALQGEPDWMSRSELRLKLREWAKYLAWQER